MKKPPGFGYSTIIKYTDKSILDFLDSMATMSPRTVIAARDRLSLFPRFVKEHYGLTIDQLVDELLKSARADRYQVLAKFAVYLKRDCGKSDDRTRKMVKQVKQLFEHHGIEFSERVFRSRVKLARAIVHRRKTPVDREQIIVILQASSNQPNLQLCLLWHAATGRRPAELFSLRHCDIDLEHRRYRIRPEFSKMRTNDERPMTAELAARTSAYIRWKHRTRDVAEFTNGHKRWITKTPAKIRPGDLLFGPYHWDGYKGQLANPTMLYFEYTQMLRDLVDSMGDDGISERVSPDTPMSPRKFTLYRLRDHAKTVISDLGYSDYSEWFIGHAGSTYYQQSEKKRAEIFANVEPSLTYLDTLALQGQHADMERQLVRSQDDYRKLAEELRRQQQIIDSIKNELGEALRERVGEDGLS